MIKYKAFIKIVECGNFTRAAKELGYSQPGISHMIDALEKEFGFSLLLRNKDTITPTEDGRKILQYCYRLVQDEKELLETVDSINGLMSGTIRVGALNSLVLQFIPDVIVNFSRAFPDIEVMLREFASDEGMSALNDGRIDLLFSTDNLQKQMEFIPLFTDPICLIMHEEHPFTTMKRIPVNSLKSCDFIMPEEGWDDLARPLIDAIGSIPHIRHMTASDTASIALVSRGMGVFPISRLQTARLPDNVVWREFKEDFHRNMGIGLRSLKSAPPAQKEFVKVAQSAAEKITCYESQNINS